MFKENPEGKTNFCFSCEKRKKIGHICGIINQEAPQVNEAGTLKVNNFTCSVHGRVNPKPTCPKCHAPQVNIEGWEVDFDNQFNVLYRSNDSEFRLLIEVKKFIRNLLSSERLSFGEVKLSEEVKNQVKEKQCGMCGEQKPISDFHRYIPYLRYFRDCKKCLHEKARLSKLRNYDPVKQRIKTLNRKLSGKSLESAKRMVEKYPEKYKARYMFRHAVNKGVIKKEPCRECGDIKVEGHHPDYSKPLEVIWLCKKHHAIIHRKESLLNDNQK